MSPDLAAPLVLVALYKNIQFWFAKQPQTSIDAYNLWTLLGASAHRYDTPYLGPLTTDQIGWALFAAVLAVACIGVWRDQHPGQWFMAAAIVACAFFVLTAQQHERYFYPALALLLGAAFTAPTARVRWQIYALYAIGSLTCAMNIAATALVHPHETEPFWLFPPAVIHGAQVLATHFQHSSMC